VFFEEIEELAAERVPGVQPGFVWYLMESANAETGAPVHQWDGHDN
jgi:hypothetical protein